MYIQVISDNMHKLTNQQVRLLNDLEYSNIYANTLNKQQNLWNHHPVKITHTFASDVVFLGSPFKAHM